MITQIDLASINLRPPFVGLFSIDDGTLETVTNSMKESGFDDSKPVNVWRRGMVLIDGHTRVRAARKVGLKSVPTLLHDFKDEDEAFEYAINCQVNRRNLSDADILKVLRELDRRRSVGRPSKTDKQEIPSSDGISAAATAAKLKTSPRKVEAARAVIDNAGTFPDVERDVLEGRKSLRAAAREVGDRKRAAGGSPKKSGKSRRARKVVPGEPRRPTLDLKPADRTGAAPELGAPLVVSPEDRAWLESLPLRRLVVAERFDDDAILYKNLAESFKAARDRVVALVGYRSEAYASPLYAALLRVCPLPPIAAWAVCRKCGGAGRTDRPCRPCRGCGYVIPKL